jgi:hypothetical protein
MGSISSDISALGTKVQAKACSARVEIWHEGRFVARHERSFSIQQKIPSLEHYLDVLAKKPGAHWQAIPSSDPVDV